MYFPRLCRIRIACSCALALVSFLVAGCSSSGNGGGSGLTGNSSVTIVASSTANDHLTRFNGTLNTLTLTSESGSTVSVLSKPIAAEFMHLNGTAEPLVTASIPKGVYTAAKATFGPTTFTCQTLSTSGGLYSSEFGNTAVPDEDVTITLASPLTITESGTELSLDLLVAKSASYPANCYSNTAGQAAFTLTPTLTLSPITSTSASSFTHLHGLVASVASNGKSMTVKSADGNDYSAGTQTSSIYNSTIPTWTVDLSSATSYSGVTGAAQLTAGMAVELDATLQADGALQASNLAVYDTDALNTSLWVGPIVFVGASEPALYLEAQEQTGALLIGGDAPVAYADASFAVGADASTLSGLPFSPSFTSSNMVAGQYVAAVFHESSPGSTALSTAPSSLTLVPQTVNGTVTGITTSGSYTVYTLALADYNLFPTLAVQDGQNTKLSTPTFMQVYVSSKTVQKTSASITLSSLVRVNGLVFNDNGALRMVCEQINDGVSE